MNDVPTAAPDPDTDWGAEADPLQRIFGIAAWWREIAAGGALGAAAALAIAFALDAFLPRYEAFADVAVVSTQSHATLDETFTTIRDARNPTSGEIIARRAALVGIVGSGDVARTVSARLRAETDLFGNDRTDNGALTGAIEAELVTIGILSNANSSDLIRIRGRSDSPEKARILVDLWAEEFVRLANSVYEPTHSKLTEAIAAELIEAQREYDIAHAEYAANLKESPSAELTRRIEALTGMMELTVGARLRTLEATYDTRRRVVRMLDNARALRDQIAAAGNAAAASSALAISLIKAEAYASLSELDSAAEIRLDAAGDDAEADAQHADLDAVVATLEDRIERIDVSLASQSRTLLGRFSDSSTLAAAPDAADSPSIAAVEEEVRILASYRESLWSKEHMFERRRDNALDRLNAVLAEDVELTLIASSNPTVVRLASSAIESVRGAWPPKQLIATVGAVAGTLTALFIAGFGAAGNRAPFFGRRRKPITPT